MVGPAQEELAEYQASSRLGLKNWDLYLNLGLAYLGQREPAPATEALETAVSLGPEYFEAHSDLAIAYEGEKRLNEALREITTARRLAPDNPDAANANAIIFVEIGETAQAQDIWPQLVRLAPDYSPAVENLSILNRTLALETRGRTKELTQNDYSLASFAVNARPRSTRSSSIWSK